MGYNDIHKLVIHQRLYGSEVLNVLWFKNNNFDSSDDDGATLASDFRTNMDTTLRARARSELFFEFVEVTRIVPFGDGPLTSSWAASTAGTVATGVQPHPASCEVMTLYTELIGRRHRGRIYLAGANAQNVSAGLWSAGQTTLTNNFKTALLGRYTGIADAAGGWQLGVWSRLIAGPTPPYDTDAFTKVSSATVRSQIRSQRRRNVGIGR